MVQKKFFLIVEKFIFVLRTIFIHIRHIFIHDVQKKHYFLIFFLFIFLLIGQMIALVGNKKILGDITISVTNKDTTPTKNIKRFMQLTRAGNYNFITFDKGEPNTWKIEGVFVKKLMLGAYPKDLTDSTNIIITIDGKAFIFSGKDVTSTWKESDKTNVMSDLQDVDIATYRVFEVPPEVRLSVSKIPVYKNFFSNIINWRDERPLIVGMIKEASWQTTLIVFVILFLRVLFLTKGVTRNKIIPLSEDDKEKTLLYILTFGLFLIILSLLLLCIQKIYRPDIAHILERASQVYLPNFYKSFRPKPVERMQFIIGALTSPVVLIFSYKIVSTYKAALKYLVKGYYQIITLVACFLLFFWFYFGMSLTGFYFTSDSIVSNMWGECFFFLLIFPTLFYLFFFEKKSTYLINYFFSIIIWYVFILIFCTNILPLRPDFPGLTFDPVLYPVSQVFAGKNLLVNLTCLYGLFPFFVTPLFTIVGLSTINFSIFLATLVCISLFFILRFLKLIIKDRSIYLMGFLFVVYYTLLATRSSPELYYQYWPIRYIFPTLSLLLSALYLKLETKFVYYSSFVVGGIAMLWNFDVGLIVFLTWLVTLTYHEVSKATSWKTGFTKIARHVLLACLNLFIVIGFFITVTYAQSGEIPHLATFFQFQKMFLAGYFMIKLVPFPHIWSFLLLIYGIGIFIALLALIKKQVTFDEKIMTLLSSMGIGLFIYYEGQSSNTTLFRVWYPALILLILFADILWRKYRQVGYSSYLHYSIFSILFLIFISAPISIVYNITKYNTFIQQSVLTSYSEKNPYIENSRFIRNYTQPKENILILANFKQAIYYTETNTRSAVDVPSLPDIFYPEEMNLLVNFLEKNTSVKIFVEQPLTSYDLYDQRIKKVILSHYKEQDHNTYGMSLYIPK